MVGDQQENGRRLCHMAGMEQRFGFSEQTRKILAILIWASAQNPVQIINSTRFALGRILEASLYWSL